ncbi:MAG: hypothetical protein JXJ20_14115 [Anaerolineae bacterium]|nr:hypothetical protein [Anaerolineae bacterium]
MFKRTVFTVMVTFMLGVAFLSSHQISLSNANAAAALPSIRACTSSELDLITIAIEDVNGDMNDLTEAINDFDLSGMGNRAVDMHLNWYQSSPDIPYCAQGVHTRLLIDRVIEVMALAAITMSYGDYELGAEYADLIDAAAQDLITYGQILGSY